MLLAFSMAAVSGGCATTEPQQLVNARSLYVTASAGATATLSPTELYDAKKVLDQANAEYVNNGDNEKVRAYAYVATRKIQLAEVKARTEADRIKIADAVKQGVVVRDAQVKDTQGALADSRQQLKDERAANTASTSELKATNAAQGKELEKSAAQLQTEREARTASETRLSAAMRDLAAVALVRDEPRGVVITLSGSVLFPTGSAVLRESAKTRLDQVAQAFSAQVDDQRMVVEGHTDNVGPNETNLPLSRNRAAAVRDYLITRGIDPNKVSSVGFGSTKPLVDNTNSENRANNRRVEIIIQPTRLTRL